MAPDPSRWQFVGYKYEPEGKCACGRPKIVHRFVLRHLDDPERELTIGSTCIDETVPWLVAMNAKNLAQAIRTQWEQLKKEQRQAAQLKAGMLKLRFALPLAATLDEWFVMLDRKIGDQIFWPDYFYRLRAGWRLIHTGGATPARRASAIMKRIGHFRDKLPLLKKALELKSLSRLWTEPPAARISRSTSSTASKPTGSRSASRPGCAKAACS